MSLDSSSIDKPRDLLYKRGMLWFKTDMQGSFDSNTHFVSELRIAFGSGIVLIHSEEDTTCEATFSFENISRPIIALEGGSFYNTTIEFHVISSPYLKFNKEEAKNLKLAQDLPKMTAVKLSLRIRPETGLAPGCLQKAEQELRDAFCDKPTLIRERYARRKEIRRTKRETMRRELQAAKEAL